MRNVLNSGVSLNFKITFMVGLIMTVLFVAISVTLVTINDQKHDGLEINLAGRQRMLSQKFTKELFADEIVRVNSGTVVSTSDSTRSLFELTLDALNNGGTTYMDLTMKTPVSLLGTSNEDIKKQLNTVGTLWDNFQKTVAQLKAQTPGTDQYTDLSKQVINGSLDVLKNMNQAVVMFQHQSERHVKFAENILYMGMVAAALVFIATVIYIRKKLMMPLIRIITHLEDGSKAVSDAAESVSATSQHIADGAVNQAASLEETSAALEEMTNSTRETAQRATDADSLTKKASTKAFSGNEIMGKMKQSIEAIHRSAEETAQIVKVIDSIAFQTNLLALNAAVEAARAGESGKGFAVVAEEVRNLALKSAEAAKNSSAMIEESLKNSREGVSISNDVAEMLNEVVTSIAGATDIVKAISDSSVRQADDSVHVTESVKKIDGVTQQNAACAEEAASSSIELKDLAVTMDNAVHEVLKLVGGQG